MTSDDITRLHMMIVDLRMLILSAKEDGNHNRVRLLQQILDRLIEKRESLINGHEDTEGYYQLD